MNRIVIASGKGGTGKTTISTGLQQTAPLYLKKTSTLLDFDVEEPNAQLFFSHLKLKKSTTITLPIPQIDTQKCTFCEKCKNICAFNAITLIAKAQIAEISKDLCHSCGACLYTCKDNAITEHLHPIGEVNEYSENENIILKEGRLKVGLPHQTALIRAIKKNHLPATDIVLMDAPPGTSCPIVTTLESSNYVVVVAEPSPFGLHDLKLLIEVIRDIGLPFGVVINKAGISNSDMTDYLEKDKIEIITQIPFSRKIAKAYSNANIKEITANKEMNKHLQKIWQTILAKEKEN